MSVQSSPTTRLQSNRGMCLHSQMPVHRCTARCRRDRLAANQGPLGSTDSTDPRGFAPFSFRQIEDDRDDPLTLQLRDSLHCEYSLLFKRDGLSSMCSPRNTPRTGLPVVDRAEEPTDGLQLADLGQSHARRPRTVGFVLRSRRHPRGFGRGAGVAWRRCVSAIRPIQVMILRKVRSNEASY